jgi:hypothetical protein
MNDDDNFNFGVESWPGYDDMVDQLKNLDELEYEDVCDLENKLIKLQQDVIKTNVLLSLFEPLSEDLEAVRLRKSLIEIEKSKEAEIFHLKIRDITEDEIVNDFKLYDCNYNLITYTEYLRLKDLWIKNKQISDDDLKNWIMKLEWLNISWSFIDKNGNIMYEDKKLLESLKNGDIHSTYLYKNIDSVINLPYPREVIQNAILIGGDTRYDSPRYCNFFCEWMKRKMMNEFMYKEVAEYIKKIKCLGNGKMTNKYLILEIVELKYGHIYNLYQIFKMIT